jgi:hypothetical protein
MAVTYFLLHEAANCQGRHTSAKYQIDADTAAELPSTYVQDGDIAYTYDSGANKRWRRVGGAWVEQTNYASGGGSLPAGLIVMWHGLLANIPSGWLLCDGTSGTPDLRSRFTKGAAAGIDPGATGGAATHSHADHAALAHAGTAVTDHPSHTHDYTQIVNHTHGVTDPGHNHTQNSHNHTQDTHNHTQNSHNHTQDAHSHVITSQTATTGGATSYEHGVLDTSSADAEASEVTATTVATNQAATATNQTTVATNQAATPTNIANTTGISTNNPAGGVATGTTAGPSATLSHSVTQPSNHAAQSHETVNHEPTFYAVAFIMKT